MPSCEMRYLCITVFHSSYVDSVCYFHLTLWNSYILPQIRNIFTKERWQYFHVTPVMKSFKWVFINASMVYNFIPLVGGIMQILAGV